MDFVNRYIDYLQIKYSIPYQELVQKYNEPHRYYHNWNHITSMFLNANEASYFDDEYGDELAISILFHDAVYDPYRFDNEEQSIEFFKQSMKHLSEPMISRISAAILNTKHHTGKSSIVSARLNILDMSVLHDTTMEQFIQYEKSIFKEYQYVDYTVYKNTRLEFLSNNNVSGEKINYVRYREPNIAVYAGSFNPLHKGHLNIVQKAEKIFDKVIIAVGNNPEKNLELRSDLPNAIKYHQVDKYDGLLTDYLKSKAYPVTLIRGLRDANDLLYESNQIAFLKELMPDIKVIEIICDKEFSHISSTAIRNLQKFNVEIGNKYLCV